MSYSDVDWNHETSEMITNSSGGSQSKLHRDWSLIPWNGLVTVLEVLQEGERKYGRDNWRLIPPIEHSLHATEHSIASLNCSSREKEVEHLSHMVCRALFALDLYQQEVKGTHGRTTDNEF